MSFKRRRADSWQEDIPGARWFKADLHVHTIDDHPGKATLPPALSGDPADPDVIQQYARQFLQATVAAGVQVIGLTPHSPRAGTDPCGSAVWAIVDRWNEDNDDDGVPFREKIFAVFPGFEPNVNDGRNGIHLLFLFDPDIGRNRYLALYDAVMDARQPWRHGALQPTRRDASEVFSALDQRRDESAGNPFEWRYVVLAPHFQGDHGVLAEMRSQVLDRFPCDRLCGYELGDEKLPSAFNREKRPGSFLLPFMEAHRQAFFHASDAYSINDIGRRHTWLKLATPRVEALRQAFVASDSRLRVGFAADRDGGLREIGDPPDVTVRERPWPWLKQVRVDGGASFFRQEGGNALNIRLSPDLTCVIGGSMTGKSTLLDGLRVHTRALLPSDKSIREQVEKRASLVFRAGSAHVELDCPGTDPTAPLAERWPAQFFSQNELQRLAQESSAVEDILARLVPSEMEGIAERTAKLRSLDGEAQRKAGRLEELDEELAEAEQALDRAIAARDALAVFSAAGVARLHEAGRDLQRWNDAREGATAIQSALGNASQGIRGLDVPELEDDTAPVSVQQVADLERRRVQLSDQIISAISEFETWAKDIAGVADSLNQHQDHVRIEVEEALASHGLNASKLREIQELSRQASFVPSYEANFGQTRRSLEAAERAFHNALDERRQLVDKQREAFDRVLVEVEQAFDGRIRASRIDDGDCGPLETFILDLRQRGITRWWNELADGSRPSPQDLTERLARLSSKSKLGAGPQGSLRPIAVTPLGGIGMSSAVQATFLESVTHAKQRHLAALRCPDRYVLDLRMDDGNYRRLDELSGGQRVSVLLSLLLETDDERPLVIDQPEDELDNRFLFETVLPALKRLKGRRQVIVATHNANVVVNGDADMVIQLEATASRGHVARAGAIEDTAVRDAIIRTVDGGEEAFRLRHRKYGY